MFHSTLGLLTHNATWCQNRGCICISSTRRTYGRIHAVSCINPVIQTRTIILQTELFPKERREKIQGEILQRPQSSFQLESKSVSSVSTCNPATTTTSLILHTELILPQEIPKKYSNYKAHPVQIVRRHPPATVPRASKHSTQQKQGSKRPAVILGPYSTSRLPVILPGRNSILHGSQPHTLPSSDSPGILQRIHLVSTKFTKRFKYYITL